MPHYFRSRQLVNASLNEARHSFVATVVQASATKELRVGGDAARLAVGLVTSASAVG